MKKLYSLLIFVLIGLNVFSQCANTIDYQYWNYWDDGTGAGNYSNDQECSWSFTTAKQGGTVRIGFYNFNTELGYDFVRIYDGTNDSAPLLAEFSGSDIPEPVRSSGQNIFMTFSSDFSNTDAGFDGYWDTGDALLTECSGYLDDGFLNSYVNNVGEFSNEGWVITPESGATAIVFEFDHLDLEDSFDYISVYDGINASGTLLGSFTGFTVPTEALIAYSGSMYFSFSTNESIVYSGWGGSWSSGLWYIPVVLSGPNALINSCSGAPEGYVLADQSCASSVLAQDSYCIDTSWDQVCQDDYNNCLGLFFGCDDFNACNFDSSANVNDGSCLYEDDCQECGGSGVIGCMDPSACNYDEQANTSCNIADLCIYPGCTDEQACNYAFWSGCDDGSCLYEDDCLECGGSGVLGCMDSSACNYDELANTSCNIADLCIYPGCTDEQACNYAFWSGCDDGSCEYNDECGNCGGTDTSGCTDPEACNFDSGADCTDNSCTYDGCTDGCTDLNACNYNSEANTDDGSCLYEDVCGDCGGSGTVQGCMDSSACNYDVLANTACNIADICSYPGCTDEQACNYDFWSGCEDGSCEYDDECGNCGGTDTSGCTDPEACNFDSGADCDDNSCTYVGCDEGCTDDTACNFEFFNTVDDGSCFYPEPGLDCSGNCVEFSVDDFDLEGNSIEMELFLNSFDGPVGEIFDMNIEVYFNSQLVDEQSVEAFCFGYWEEPFFKGDEQEWFGDCSISASNVSTDGFCGVVEIEVIWINPVSSDCLSSVSGFVDLGECADAPGCTNVAACNYDADATEDNGSCLYFDQCGNCGGTDISGCTDPVACNYDSNAGCSDESCILIGDSCDDGESDTVNDIIQNNCDCEGELNETEGCTDSLACNFNPNASIDDGTCEYLELFDIIGNTSPDPLTSEDYFYSSTLGSSYVWEASNGAVTAGQGTTSPTVVWGESGLASISVTETNEDGCEGEMVTEEFNISSTSLTEISAESLSVYPNPASSFLIIKSDLLSSGNNVIKLIDSKGRLVLEETLDKDNRLDVSGVANGVYFLNLISEHTVQNLRIVIQK